MQTFSHCMAGPRERLAMKLNSLIESSLGSLDVPIAGALPFSPLHEMSSCYNVQAIQSEEKQIKNISNGLG